MGTCQSCKKEKESVKEQTIKENGVLGYYDVTVTYYDECVASHNHYLLADWG